MAGTFSSSHNSKWKQNKTNTEDHNQNVYLIKKKTKQNIPVGSRAAVLS